MRAFHEDPNRIYTELTFIMFSFILFRRKINFILYPWYELYRGYIVFAFSVIMFVCRLSVYFFLSNISQQLHGLGF